MNLSYINPYNVIENLKKDNEELKKEIEELKKRLKEEDAEDEPLLD